MNRCIFSGIVTLACLLPLQFAVASEKAAGAASTGSLAEVMDCVRDNAPRKTMMHRAKVTRLDSAGKTRELEWKLYWKNGKGGQPKIFLRVESPSDWRGRAFLMIGRAGRPDDMWMYLPETRKARRISAQAISGSLLGTDLRYEDIEHMLSRFKDLTGTRLPDSELDGRAVHVVALEPAEGSTYSRIVSYVDHEYCVPTKVEFYEGSDTVTKILRVDPEKMTREANTWMPREIVVRDIEGKSETRLVVEKVEVDAGIPDRRFSQSQLEKGR